MKNSMSIVLLAYGEADNLKVFLPRVIKSVEPLQIDYEILVIDAMVAVDISEEICIENNATYISQEEPGYGGAFRTGIKHASKSFICVLDVDGSHEPEVIPQLYAKINSGYDMVIGSRYVKGGKTNDGQQSIIMSKLLNNTFRFFLGISAKDISTSFRIYRAEQVKKVALSCRNFDVLEEVVFMQMANKPGFKIGEVPINFNKRLFGESKRNLIPFIISYIKTLLRLFSLRILFFFSSLANGEINKN